MKEHNKHIIVIGASAGGILALIRLLSFFPKDFKPSILIVVHVSPSNKSFLPNILQRYTSLPVCHPKELEQLKEGHIYVAPPDVHMSLGNSKIYLRQGPKINHSRPAIDALFYSAALYYGPLAIGIILSGLLDDGSAGLLAIKKCKGTTMVQDPNEADFPDMPLNALKTGIVDYTLKLEEMYPLIIDIIKKPPEIDNKKSVYWDDLSIESELNYNQALNEKNLLEKISKPSAQTCPDCGGVLWKLNDNSMNRYRCRVGHAFSQDGLIHYQNDRFEKQLWEVLRLLEEKKDLLKFEKVSKKMQEEFNQLDLTEKYLRKLLNL